MFSEKKGLEFLFRC